METKKVILAALVAFMAFLPLASAAPVISNLFVSPSAIWLGDPATLSLECKDSINISYVSAFIRGPGITLPSLNFSESGSSFSLKIEGYYLSKNGKYTADIICMNDQKENATTTAEFTVSVLSGRISSTSPSNIFIGDKIDIGFVVEKDGSRLKPPSASVSFKVFINNNEQSLLQMPLYEESRGWVLKINAPPTTGTYDLEVRATYNGKGVSNSTEFEVKQPVSFGIISTSPEYLIKGMDLVLILEVNKRGIPVDLEKSHLNIKMNSIPVLITNITKQGGEFVLQLDTPTLNPGTYDLDIKINLDNFTGTRKKQIVYAVPVSGEIIDSNGKGVSLELRFTSNTSRITTFKTDSKGKYSGLLAPGTYDIVIKNGKSELRLDDVDIDEYDDPISFFSMPGTTVPGLDIAGFYVAETSLDFENATLELEYSDGGIDDETEINMFKCGSWNAGKKQCTVNWIKIYPDIDITKNIATVEVNSLSAFAIGDEESLHTDFIIERGTYYMNEIVKISGVVTDGSNAPILDAKVDLEIKGQNIKKTVTSGSGGVFKFEVTPPQKEGSYTIRLSLSKSPYVSSSEEKSFVLKNRIGIFAIIPDSIRLKRGESRSYDFKITNTGQSELSNIQVKLTGIPEEMFSIRKPVIQSIKPSEEIGVEVFFTVPEDSVLKTYSARFNVSAGAVSSEGVFALTIMEAVNLEETEGSGFPAFPAFAFPSLQLPTANVIASTASGIAPIVLLSVVAFVSVAILRKKKVTDEERIEVTNLLNDIKREIDREDSSTVKVKKRSKRRRKR